jgi:hypothetical protein
VGVMAGTRGKVDVKSLQKFKANMAKLNRQQTSQFTEAAIKELAGRLLRKVKFRTPVGIYPASSGKTGGTLRRGWEVGEVVKEGSVYTIEIVNPVVYAPYVEFGHRTVNNGWVEGRFMMTISELELQRDAPRLLQSKLNSFVKGVFNAK